MAIIQDSNENSNSYTNYYGTSAIAQLFEPSENYAPVKIGMKLFRTGSNFSEYSNVRYYIYEVDGSNEPDILFDYPIATSAAEDPDDVTSSTTGEWIELNITCEELTSGTKYAIVMYQTYFDSSHYINARHYTSSGYDDGYRMYWDGYSWEHYTGTDFAFRVYSINAESESSSVTLGVASSNEYNRSVFRQLSDSLGILSNLAKDITKKALTSLSGIVGSILKSKGEQVLLTTKAGISSIINNIRNSFKTLSIYIQPLSEIKTKIGIKKILNTSIGFLQSFGRKIELFLAQITYLGLLQNISRTYDKLHYYEFFFTRIGYISVADIKGIYNRREATIFGILSEIDRKAFILRKLLVNTKIFSKISRKLNLYRMKSSLLGFISTKTYNYLRNYVEDFSTILGLLSNKARNNTFIRKITTYISNQIDLSKSISYNIKTTFSIVGMFVKNAFCRVRNFVVELGIKSVFLKLARLIIKYIRDKEMAFSRNYTSLTFLEEESELKFKE